MRNGFCGRQTWIAGHRKQRTHTSRRGTYDDNPVGVLGGRNFPVQNVVERVHNKRWLAIPRFVKLWKHECPFIGFDPQFSDLHRLARIQLDICREQIETFDCRQKRHGRHCFAVVVDQQRLLSDGTVYIMQLIQVGDASRSRAQ